MRALHFPGESLPVPFACSFLLDFLQGQSANQVAQRFSLLERSPAQSLMIRGLHGEGDVPRFLEFLGPAHLCTASDKRGWCRDGAVAGVSSRIYVLFGIIRCLNPFVKMLSRRSGRGRSGCAETVEPLEFRRRARTVDARRRDRRGKPHASVVFFPRRVGSCGLLPSIDTA